MQVSIDVKGIEDVQKAITRMQVQSNKSSFTACKFAAGRYCLAQKSIFNPAKRKTKKKREIIVNPHNKHVDEWLVKEIRNRRQRLLDICTKGKVPHDSMTHEERVVMNEIRKRNLNFKTVAAKYIIVKYLQRIGNDIKEIKTDNKKDKRTKILKRGLASKLWNILAAKVKGTQKETTADGKWFSFSVLKSKENEVTWSVHNKLGYLLSYDPQAHDKAITSTANQMNGMLDREAKKIIDKFDK